MTPEVTPVELNATKSRAASAGTAAYMNDLLTGMTGMARKNGHGFLAYLLDVAAHEAARLAKKP
jgi:hypothetical protein